MKSISKVGLGAVDVRSVLRDLARLARDSGGDEGPEGNKPAFDLWQDAIKAHDAIAELIHAVKAEREARAAVARERAQLASGEITPEDLHPGADAPDGISTSQRHIEAVHRVARALASCGAEK